MTHANGSNGSPGALVRPRFVHRQVVTAHDLNAGEDYVVERLRRHNRALHGCGVVCGLLAEVHDDGLGGRGLRLSAGVAIDGAGNEIDVPDAVVVALDELCWSADGRTRATWPPPSHDDCGGDGPGLERYYLAICHAERHDCPRPVAAAPCDGATSCDHLRLRAGYELILLAAIGPGDCVLRGLPIDEPDWRYELWGHSADDAPAAVLAGPPAVRRRVAFLSASWGASGPDPAIAAERFAGRWARRLHFPAGRYRFSTSLRGGRAGVPTSSVTLAGIQERGTMRVGLRTGLGDIQEDRSIAGLEGALAPRLADRLAGVGVEFVALTAAEAAVALQAGTVDVLAVRLDTSVVPGGSSPLPYLLGDDDGRGLVTRAGDPAFGAQVEDALAGLVDDGEWSAAYGEGESGPAPHPGAALVGGLAVAVDGRVVLDRARAVGDADFSFDALLDPGAHTVELLHFGPGGQPGGVRLAWAPLETGWHAAYYTFQGEQGPDIDALGAPVLVRVEPGIALDLGNNEPPADGVPGTHFATRWQRDVAIEAPGEYEFDATTDDGMRIAVNGESVLDTWQPQAPTRYRARASLRAGLHRFRVDFFQRRGLSVAKVRWRRVGPYNPACEAPPEPGCVVLAAVDLDEGQVEHVENFAIEPVLGIGRRVVPSAASFDPTPADPGSHEPAIAQIVPGTAFIGASATAVIFGRGLRGTRDIRFADGAITGRVLPGATDSWVPVAITVSPDATAGLRGFTLGTPHCSIASEDFGIRFAVAAQPAAEPGDEPGGGFPFPGFPLPGGGIFERFPDLEIAQPEERFPGTIFTGGSRLPAVEVVAGTQVPAVDPGVVVTAGGILTTQPATGGRPIEAVLEAATTSTPVAETRPLISADFVEISRLAGTGAVVDSGGATAVAAPVAEAAPASEAAPVRAEAAPLAEAAAVPVGEAPLAEAAPLLADLVSTAVEPVTAVGGIGPARAERLAGAGISNVGELATAEVETVRTALGFSESRAAEVIRNAGRALRP